MPLDVMTHSTVLRLLQYPAQRRTRTGDPAERVGRQPPQYSHIAICPALTTSTVPFRCVTCESEVALGEDHTVTALGYANRGISLAGLGDWSKAAQSFDVDWLSRFTFPAQQLNQGSSRQANSGIQVRNDFLNFPERA